MLEAILIIVIGIVIIGGIVIILLISLVRAILGKLVAWGLASSKRVVIADLFRRGFKNRHVVSDVIRNVNIGRENREKKELVCDLCGNKEDLTYLERRDLLVCRKCIVKKKKEHDKKKSMRGED